MAKLSIKISLAALAAITLLGACAPATTGGPASSASPAQTIYFGVSGPLTGPSAEYGEYWKEGFDLALAEINADGGIDGVPLALKWEDSQSGSSYLRWVEGESAADEEHA